MIIRTAAFILAAGIFFFCAAPAEPGRENLIVPFTERPVNVDGSIDEADWQGAAEFGPALNIARGDMPDETMSGRVLHDDTHLYIAVKCEAEPPGAAVKLPRDHGGIFEHDNVDIHIAPSADSSPYYQFVVDRFGNVYDRHWTEDRVGELGVHWRGDWKSAAGETENGWTLELAIPFSDFKVSRPSPGEVWRFRAGRSGGKDGPVMWPLNPFPGFHAPGIDAVLYFCTDNMLDDAGRFESTETGAPPPPPWSASPGGRGTAKIIADERAAGGRALLMAKPETRENEWRPQVWTPRGGLELIPGASYELSALLRNKHPEGRLLMRMDALVGDERIRIHREASPSEEYARYYMRFTVPEGAQGARVGFSTGEPTARIEIAVDDVRLRRVIERHEAKPEGEKFPTDTSPPHNLQSFVERAGLKPWDLFRRGNELITNRLIFEDAEYGTEVWMLDNSPVTEYAGTGSVWPAWNADASLIQLRALRPFAGGNFGALMTEDYSRLIPAGADRYIWDRENPHVYFRMEDGRLYKGDARSREEDILAEWEPYRGERIYGLTEDRRYLFLDTPNGGIWMPYEPGDIPIPERQLHDGRPGGPMLDDGRPPHPRDDHSSWRPEGSPTMLIASEDQKWGPLARVRVGKLIDVETGQTEHVIAPLAGYDAYLSAFMGENGRIIFPEGGEWEKYRVHKSDNLDEMFDIFNYYPFSTHGHGSISPDRRFIAKDGRPTIIYCTRTGDAHNSITVSGHGGPQYHLHWKKHPRFFVGWVRGWSFVRYTTHKNANVVYQAFTDGTWQPVFNTGHKFNSIYSGADFSMQSPDATKIHAASNMTGRFRSYAAVMARPRPPSGLLWEPGRNKVKLSWSPPSYNREIKGYLVYRSGRSGDDYELLTPEPVKDTRWNDYSVEAGRDYYYVVSSLENSGLESGYSNEAARAGVGFTAQVSGHLTVYAEAEEAVRDIPSTEEPGLAVGRDAIGASDWYYVYRHPGREFGIAHLQLQVPDRGRYTVWARIRSRENGGALWKLEIEGAAMDAATTAEHWTWVKAGFADLEAGGAAVSFSTETRGSELDMICLTTDAGFEPDGPRPEDKTRPEPPARVTVENVLARTNRLQWEGPRGAAFSHYNVYAAREPFEQPKQKHLIASPSEPELIDWGLLPDSRYYYAVTAVDRRRNESNPAFAESRTPPRETPEVSIELSFDEALLEGPFEKSAAAGSRGLHYLVPEDPGNNRAAWRINVPHEDEYFFWLRYLQRGEGRRAGTVNQWITILLNGKPVLDKLGGRSDLLVNDDIILAGHPLAGHVWTWTAPGVTNLEGIPLPAGEHTLQLEGLHGQIRYDTLLITNEPSFLPPDGRIRY